MSSRIWRKELVAVLAATCLALVVQPAQAQFAVVSVKSIDDVFDAIKVVAEKAGEGEKAKQLGAVKLFLSGIDTTKPFGIYVGVPKDKDTPPPAVAFIPVSKEDDLLDLLKQFQVEVGKPEKEVRSIAAPDGKSAFIRFANGHVYMSERSEALEGKLPEPSKLLMEESKTHLMAVKLHVGQLPKKMRQDAVAELKKNIEREREKKEGEKESAYEGRLLGMKLVEELVTDFVLDAQDVSFNFKIDAKTDKLTVDVATTAAPGSNLAANIKKLGTVRSKFAGLAADSAFNVLCALPVPAKTRADFGKVFAKAFQEQIAEENDADAKKFAERVVDTMRECLDTDALDFGVVLTGPYSDKLVSFVAGIQVKQGMKVDELLRATAKDPKRKGEVKLDVDKVGGTAIHLLVPKNKEKLDENMKSFGNQDVFVCARDDAILMSMGKHGLSALKDAIGKLDRATPAKDTDPVQLELSFLKIAQIEHNGWESGVADIVRKTFAAAPKGADRLRLSLHGGESLRVHFDMSLELVKVAAAVGKARAQEQ
jgi:hypothetical protein